MRINFEYMTNLQYKVKALQAQVDAFQSGEAYLRQKEEYEKRLREKDRIIAALKKELGRSHAETVTMRDRSMDGSIRGPGEGTQESHVQRTEENSPDGTAHACGREKRGPVA